LFLRGPAILGVKSIHLILLKKERFQKQASITMLSRNWAKIYKFSQAARTKAA
jgi:hypothetical protein